MAATVMTDTLRRLAYLASEMGENLVVEPGGATVNSKLAVNGATVLSPGTTLTNAKTHTQVVDKTILVAP